MKRMPIVLTVAAFTLAGFGLACNGGGGDSDVVDSDGTETTDEGTTDEGEADEGAADEGAADEGATDEGATDEGATDEGATDEGATDEGATDEDASLDTTPPVPDADQPDSEPIGDTGAPEDADDPPLCTGVCGDANNDGVVNDLDVVTLGGILQGNPGGMCPEQQSDVITDGDLTVADLHALRALVNGTGSGGCEYCSNECGDVNADDIINILDVTTMNDIVSNGTPDDVCVLWSADVNGDGLIAVCPTGEVCNNADSDILVDYIVGNGDLNCAPAMVIPQN